MAEYIERVPKCHECIHDGVCYMQEICNDIEEQLREFGCDNFKPAADVVEVRHGYWIESVVAETDTSKLINWWCSECSIVVDRNNDNYCPNCGADMRGDGNVDL